MSTGTWENIRFLKTYTIRTYLDSSDAISNIGSINNKTMLLSFTVK